MLRPVFRLALWASVFATISATTEAQTPRITGLSSLGVRRGTTSILGFVGQGLNQHPRLIAPFAFEVESSSRPEKGPEAWELTFRVAKDTPIGVHIIRLQTDDGLSNPFPLAIGQVEQVAEIEDNSRFEVAQRVSMPCVVEGKAAGSDIDYFRFSGKRADRIVVDAQCARLGSKVDPSIRLTTGDRKLIAAADDTPGLLTDARLFATLPADGDYVVELSDSRYIGGNQPSYRLLIGAVPVAEEIYPLGGRRGEVVGFELRGGSVSPGSSVLGVARTIAPTGLDLFQPRFTGSMLGLFAIGVEGFPGIDLDSPPWLVVSDYPEMREPEDIAAEPIVASPPVVLNGRIETPGDEDLFLVSVTPGTRYRFDVSASDLGSALDGILEIRNPAGSVLASADDTKPPADSRMQGRKAPSFVSPDPSLEYTIPAGTPEIMVSIKDLRRAGGIGYPYRITVEPVAPTFDLNLGPSELNLLRGGTVAVGVTVLRRGFNGPITLDISDPPAGLHVRQGAIAEGAAVGSFSVTTSSEAKFERVNLRVTGRASASPAGPVIAGTRLLSLSPPDQPPSLVLNQVGLPAAIAMAPPLSFGIDPGPIELAHGHSLAIPVKVIRTPGLEGSPALAIASYPLPPGFAVPESTIAEGLAQGEAKVVAAIEAPLGRTSVVLTAKGKVGGRERTLALPAVIVDVVRPASASVNAPVTLKPGETFELRGRVERKAPFAGPVTVRLEGLPTGLSADPGVVPPERSDFTLKLIAAGDAPAATLASRLVAAFQVDKKDYPPVSSPVEVKVLPR